MGPRLHIREALAGASLVTLLSLACNPLPPSAPTTAPSTAPADAPPSPTATPAASSRPASSTLAFQTATVQRGPIAEVLSLSGRVGGQDEVGVSFPMSTQIVNVAVQPGQHVEQGQLLLEGDPATIQADLDSARGDQEAAEAKLQKAMSPVQARLTRELEDLARLKAGPTETERLSAESNITQARAGLQRAEADLARLLAPPADLDLQIAEQDVNTARLALQRAEADRTRLANPDPSVLRKAENDLAAAQNAFDTAQAALNTLLQGPDPVKVRAAQRQLDQAKADLQAVQDTKADKSNRAQRDAAIRRAEVAVQVAEENLAAAQQPPTQMQIDIAQRNVEIAQRSLQDARERRDTLLKGPDQLTLANADGVVENARNALAKAENRYNQLQAGPSPDQVTAARAAVQASRNSVSAAEARMAQLFTPQPAQLDQIRQSEARVDSLRVVLDGSAIDDAAVAYWANDREVSELIRAQKAAADARATVQTLEANLAATRLVAPAAGLVTAVQVRSGDSIGGGQPAVLIAQSDASAVRAQLSDRDASRVEVGQPASVRLESNSDQKIAGQVAGLTENAGVREVLLQVTWPTSAPSLGSPLQVAITLQHKDDTLIVPQRAIRQVGGRRYVDVIDGANPRRVEVEVGITSGNDAEIVSGLREGQQVVVGL